MRFVADENFPRPALEALRDAGWEVFSVAEECPGISDEEVAALCSETQRILLTFDKDFGELIPPSHEIEFESGQRVRPRNTGRQRMMHPTRLVSGGLACRDG